MGDLPFAAIDLSHGMSKSKFHRVYHGRHLRSDSIAHVSDISIGVLQGWYVVTVLRATAATLDAPTT